MVPRVISTHGLPHVRDLSLVFSRKPSERSLTPDLHHWASCRV